MLTLVIVEGIVILLLAVLVAGLLRSHAEILRRLDALGAGEEPDTRSTVPLGNTRRRRTTPAERVDGITPEGSSASVALTGSRGPTLLAFLSTGCSTCRPLWEELDAGADLIGARLVVVTQGPERESPAEIARLGSGRVTTVMSTDAWDAFAVPGTPYFVLVDASGAVLGDGSAGSWSQVGDLVSRAGGDRRISAPTADRLRDTEAELRRAGIEPDDPSLYPEPGEEPA